MGKTTIEFPFSADGINQAIAELKAYEQSTYRKAKQFVNELALAGISVGRVNGGEWSNYLHFTVVPENYPWGGSVSVVMKGDPVYISYLVQNDQVKTVTVNSALMSEFGSGWLADDYNGKKVGAGQGTFPGQTHAFDASGWYYKDMNGVWHNTKGSPAYAPLHHCAMEVALQVNNIAKRVFI